MDEHSADRARLLVADDSKLMRKAALKMLGDEFDVLTAEDGLQAWALLQQDPSIQVLFTDLNMPNADGYALLRLIRGAEDPRLRDLPVIVVTGAENDEAARTRALDGGATDFIGKPFTSTDLVARARAHASHRRITATLQAQAATDPVTGLASRGAFLTRLQQDLAYARRHAQPLAVVRIEIDDFRRIFLYHGRERADALMRQVAGLVRARIRKEDTAARIGLGGIGLSLPGGHAGGVAGVIDRLQAEIIAGAPLDEHGEKIALALSAAVVDAGDDDAATVFARCEAAMAQFTGLPERAPAPEPAPVPAPEPEPVTPTVSPPLRLDPLLDALAAGDPRPLQEKLPAAVGRLLPLFRLLGPNQRAQLVAFLQRLG